MFKKIGAVCSCLMLLLSANMVCAQNEGKIALVMKALSNPFFLKMQTGAKEYADKQNLPLEVFGIERETEVDRQISIVENLIARGYGAIVIAPADSKLLIPVCKKAIEKGIFVVNIDNPFHKETLKENNLTIPFVGSDNRAGAAMVGNYIKQKIGKTGKVLVIEGMRGVENADLRKQGFIESVTSGTEIKIAATETANWHTDEAFTVVSNLLQQDQDIQAIFCANDSMALGAVQALDMLGLAGKILVGAYDNLDEARQEMRNQRMHATVEQHPELMGAYGVALAARALAGETLPDYTTTPLDLITYEGFEKKIGLSISNAANPFFASLLQGAQRAAELFGVQLVIVDAGDDDAKQLLDLQTFIETPVNLILLNPTNAETVSPAIEMADSSGIKVITVDRKSSRDDLVASHVASDNVAGGRIAAEFIASKLQGKGAILELEGIPGTSAAHDRGLGFNDVVKTYPELKVASREVGHFDKEKARVATAQLLQQGQTFDAVFAHNDQMILGAIEAFDAAKTEKRPIFVGFDAIPEALEAVKQQKLHATVAQKPENMGWAAIDAAVKFLRGESLAREVFVDLELIKTK